MRKEIIKKREFTLNFSSVTNSSRICVLDHNSGKCSSVDINIFDQDFQYRIKQDFPSIIADLIDIAVAVHASDRLSEQKLDQSQTYINVILPVRNLTQMTNEFREKLEDLLEWATGSRWSFTFQKRILGERNTELQHVVATIPEDCEVALWSGGLDALAGLCTRLQLNPSKSFLLFGTGSNDTVYSRQEDVFNALKKLFPNRLYLCRVPIRFSDSYFYKKNKISRARGVVFTFLGAACAHLMNQNALYLYENGIGAINLPYIKSSIGLDHSRSVHPITLLKVSDVLSDLLGQSFTVNNPFLFWTKAEMCRSLFENRSINVVKLTSSCDSPHRKQPTQCGYCSSCLLRKQSLSASMIRDETRYVVPHGEQPKGDVTLHFRHMKDQVSVLKSILDIDSAPSTQWEALTQRFPELDDIVDRMCTVEEMPNENLKAHLIRLYQSYISEWSIVESDMVKDCIKSDSFKIFRL